MKNKINLSILKYPSIILDTGPLVVYLVGKFNTNLLSDDEKIIFQNLDFFLSQRKKYVTPHILSEFSNIVSRRYKEHKAQILFESKYLINNSFEIYIPKEDIFDHRLLGWLGVADVSLLEANKQKLTLLTKERELYTYCMDNNLDALFLPTFLSRVE